MYIRNQRHPTKIPTALYSSIESEVQSLPSAKVDPPISNPYHEPANIIKDESRKTTEGNTTSTTQNVTISATAQDSVIKTRSVRVSVRPKRFEKFCKALNIEATNYT